jgi:transcriptional regulator with XRE-family HTH domain
MDNNENETKVDGLIIQRTLHLLKEKSLKARDLCDYLDINQSTMSNWKNRNTDPTAKYLVPICEFLDVSYEYLLTGKEDTTTNLPPTLSQEDTEWLDLIHQLPKEAQLEFRGELKGYLKRLKSESVAADETPRIASAK